MEHRPILSVSQVNAYIKNLLDGDGNLSGLFVRGEVSNYKVYPSGHCYFSLKDAEGILRAVIFRREASALRFQPQNGMKVIAFGRVTAFPRDGQYQLYCSRLMPDGVGELHIAFEQLKEKLRGEGLFDPGHKKPIPAYPQRIVLITSPAGAAVRDMIRVLGARWPSAWVRLLPVRVQGAEAPAELCAALGFANRSNLGDLIILGRGGGSMEDLWAFNDEGVARAIFASRIPVISAVGHETDVTISDFAADLRAATPSNGAELAVPDRKEILDRLSHLNARLNRGETRIISEARSRLLRFSASRAMTNPENYLRDKRLLLDYQSHRLVHGLDSALNRQKTRLGRLSAALDALSPLKVLGRGYSIARGESGLIITASDQVKAGERLAVRLARGTLTCLVEGKE
ncbi:Exodeoxyribonuclease 7 large subunit [bioreactor metagenome]|uniref:Exodeoxyribonuclease 7 large subunit n=1 Tax=bioreactor metagenome TaxID=1076179 RepID=A0A644YMU8_9ZZZZ